MKKKKIWYLEKKLWILNMNYLRPNLSYVVLYPLYSAKCQMAFLCNSIFNWSFAKLLSFFLWVSFSSVNFSIDHWCYSYWRSDNDLSIYFDNYMNLKALIDIEIIINCNWHCPLCSRHQKSDLIPMHRMVQNPFWRSILVSVHRKGKAKGQ